MNFYAVLLAGVIVVGLIVVVVALLFRSGRIRVRGELPGRTRFEVDASSPAPAPPVGSTAEQVKVGRGDVDVSAAGGPSVARDVQVREGNLRVTSTRGPAQDPDAKKA